MCYQPVSRESSVSPAFSSSARYAYLNAVNIDGRTALHFASQRGHIDCVAVLLRAGSNPSIVDEEGNTAADLARENGHHDVADLITEFALRRNE